MQLKLWDDTKKDIYKKLKTRRFVLTPAYDLALLRATGMNTKFELIFKVVGWEDVWEINEPGSKLLTAQFLCTLKPTEFGSIIWTSQKRFSDPMETVW